MLVATSVWIKCQTILTKITTTCVRPVISLGFDHFAHGVLVGIDFLRGGLRDVLQCGLTAGPRMPISNGWPGTTPILAMLASIGASPTAGGASPPNSLAMRSAPLFGVNRNTVYRYYRIFRDRIRDLVEMA
jgi:hypothetical protein